MYKVSKKRNFSLVFPRGKIILMLLCLLVYVFPSTAAAKETETTVFDKVLINGMHVFKYEDISYVYQPFQGELIEDKAKFIEDTTKAINQHYIDHGYIFSMVSNCEIVDRQLSISIVEGSINEVKMPTENEKILEIDYVKDYISQLKSIQPFNIKEAEKHFILLKRLLGRDLTITPVFLDQSNMSPDDHKIVDLFIFNYKKVKGSFSVDNSYHSSISADDLDVQDVDIAQNSGYFTMGEWRAKINNPYSVPGNLNFYLSSSGDKKENILFAGYSHQVNSKGTQLKLTAGYDQFNFTNRHKDFFTVAVGASHPFLLTNNHQLDLYTTVQFYAADKNYKQAVNPDDLSSSDVFKAAATLQTMLQNLLAEQLNNKSDVTKIIVGGDYEVKLLKSNNTFVAQAHVGKNNQRFPSNSSSNVHGVFNKFVFESKFEYPLPENFTVTLYMDGQYSNSNTLPVDEYFSGGKSPGGRGFLPTIILGKSGVQASFETSHLNKIDHPLLIGVNEYAYVNFAKVTEVPNGYSGTKILSFGAGIDAYLVDNVVVNLELNKPIQQDIAVKNNANENQLKLFAGLKYFFSF